jgi:hypothetical protein
MINFSELAKLMEKVIFSVQGFIKQEMHDFSYKNGDVCFLALEYFYDGEYADIGLRIGLEEERKRLQSKSKDKDYDVREDGGNFDHYVRILDNEKVEPYSNALISFLKGYDDSRQIVYGSIKDLADEMTKLLKKTNWNQYAKITNDFAVLGPYEYD